MSENKQQPEELNWEELKPQLIKLGLELGPLVLFFVVNARAQSLLDSFPVLGELFGPKPIILATGVFMVAMVVSLIASWLMYKKLAVMPLVTGVVVLVFGGLTIYFQDEMFIKLKPTIVNMLFGFVLLGGLLAGHSLLKYVFGDVYKLKAEGWRVLTWRWCIFFFVLAALNEIVWRNFSNDFWVSFKVWGIMPLTLIFSFALVVPILNKYAPDKDDAEGV